MLIICPANLASPQTRKHNPKNKTEFPPEFEIRCSHGLQVRAARDHTGPRTRVLKTDIAMQPAVGTRGVYVLELETGGFYVGKSENVQARVRQHLAGAGSSRYCRAQGGATRILPTLTPAQENLAAWEQSETLAQMRKHGFDNVRGFEWTRCGPLEASDYQTIRTLLLGNADLCRRCGGEGHFAAQCGKRRKQAWLQELEALCPAADKAVSKNRRVFKRTQAGASSSRKRKQKGAKRLSACARCGRDSHTAKSCYARTRADGMPVDDSEEESLDSGSEGFSDSMSDSDSTC